MTPDQTQQRARLRRYMLGELGDPESAAVEEQYFTRRADALDEVSAAEDDLIEDYLEHRLDPRDRARFERHYMATPGHRARVAVIHALRNAAVISANAEREANSWWTKLGLRAIGEWSPFQQAAFAGALLLVLALGVLWVFGPLRSTPPVTAGPGPAKAPEVQDPSIFRPEGARPGEAQDPDRVAGGESVPSVAPPPDPRPQQQPGQQPPGARRTPIVLALSLSPTNVRGAGDEQILTIPAGTDVVLLRLEGDADTPQPQRPRVVIRTVGGAEVWRGNAERDRAAKAGAPATLARVQIPASSLRADDFIVELHDGSGGEASEIARYFLRVRSRG